MYIQTLTVAISIINVAKKISLKSFIDKDYSNFNVRSIAVRVFKVLIVVYYYF